MRKHLFSFIAAASMLFAGAGTAWADDLTFGYTIADITSNTAVTIQNGDETNVTVETIKGNVQVGSGSAKKVYQGSTTAKEAVAIMSYRDKYSSSASVGTVAIGSKSDEGYFGISLDVASGHLLTLSKLSLSLYVGSDKFGWNLSIYNSDGECLYTSGDKTPTTYNSSKDDLVVSTDLSSVEKLKGLSGKIYAKLFYWTTNANGSK